MSGILSREHDRPNWCAANRCSRRARAGWPICEYHLRMLAEEMIVQIRGLDPVGLVYAPASEVAAEGLELVDAVVTAIADAERGSAVNTWGIRARVMRDILGRRELPRQATLLEEHPDLNGAYGPDGRRQ